MKKGFTLIELLGVIIILGVIAVITIPVLTNTLKKSREKAYNEQVKTIENAAKNWGLENVDLLPAEIDDPSTAGVEENAPCYISLNTLVSSGQLTSNDIKNPKDNNSLVGNIYVEYNNTYNQYSYTFNEEISSTGEQCQ